MFDRFADTNSLMFSRMTSSFLKNWELNDKVIDYIFFSNVD